MELSRGGVVITGTSLRMIENLESIGCQMPCPAEHMPAAALRYAMQLAEHYHSLGVLGTMDIDLGVKDGEVVALFETNIRRLLTSIPIGFADRCRDAWDVDNVYVIYDEAPPIAANCEGLTIADIRAWREEAVTATLAGGFEGGHVLIDGPTGPIETASNCWFPFQVAGTSPQVVAAARATFRLLVAARTAQKMRSAA